MDVLECGGGTAIAGKLGDGMHLPASARQVGQAEVAQHVGTELGECKRAWRSSFLLGPRPSHLCHLSNLYLFPGVFFHESPLSLVRHVEGAMYVSYQPASWNRHIVTCVHFSYLPQRERGTSTCTLCRCLSLVTSTARPLVLGFTPASLFLQFVDALRCLRFGL